MTDKNQEILWFCATPEGNKGPFSAAKMDELLQKGVINQGTYIWREGFKNWMKLSESGAFDTAATPAKPAAATPAPAAVAAPASVSLTDSSTGAESDTAPSSSSSAAENQIPDSEAQDDYLDSLFVAQVKQSWERHNRKKRATEVDEVLLGGVITGCLDNGYSLIDLGSDGTHHHLRFEDIGTGNRVIFRLTHLAESLLTAEVLGHEAQVVVGYGERVKDFGKIWKALRQEAKGGYIRQVEPGIITIDGDVSSQYVYVEVGLIWDINDYLESHYAVNYPKLTQDIGASIHALRKYLRGRFSVMG